MATTMASHEGGAQANQLNRELLRWIQSLDLAYSIKNVKRDFANGFLVAEIMSRYYDKDISMHSYDNGIGVKVKKDNWDQLHRVFSRIPDLEPLTSKVDMDAVIHCQNGAAVAFVTKLYQCLTKRTIQPSVAPSATAPAVAKAKDGPEEIPPYAKPTGTAVIREKMRSADIAEVSDEMEISRKVRSIHSQHEEQLQMERLLAGDTPDRYPSLRSATKATVLRGATKPVRNDEGPALMTQHVVKEVQIKSMNEKSLEKLRLNREAKESESYAQSRGNGNAGSGASLGMSFAAGSGAGGYNANGASELVQRRRPMDLLSEAVGRNVPAPLLNKLDQRGKDKFDAFIDALHDGRLMTEEEGASLLGEVTADALVLAHAFLDFPRDMWKFGGCLLPFLAENEEDHALFASCQHTLLRVGRMCVRRDGSAAMLLLNDYLLPKIVAMLDAHTTKRAPLLQIVYAFAPVTVLAHIQVIKRLREAIPNDIPLFIHALSIMLYMETELDETLVDLYHYYCCIGLETPCEKLRAACLSMLVCFLSYDVSLVADVLPRLTLFASRHAWWEVKTQLVVVASAFLHAVAQSSSSRDYTEQIELALTIIESEFHPTASLNVRRVGLSYLAKNLSQYQELVPLFVDVLLSVPHSVRSVMLAAAPSPQSESREEDDGDSKSRPVARNALPVRGTSGAHYTLLPLAPQWDSVAIAKQIYYEHKTRGHADVDSMHVLHACVAQLVASGGASDALALYDQMRGFVVLGLLDSAACGETARLLLALLAADECSPDDVLAHDALRDALRALVSCNVDDIRQQSAVKLLHDAHALGGGHSAAVRRCVQALAAQSDAAAFRASLFSISLDA